LRVYPPSKSFSNINNIKYSTNYTYTQLNLWNKKIGLNFYRLNTRLTNKDRLYLTLTPRVKSILIGLILSDSWIQKRVHWNPRVGLKQSFINFSYLWSVYSEISYLCSNLPMWGKETMRGKIFYSVSIQTRQLLCLNEIYNLFYDKNSSKKLIKDELFFYMDYIVLANWIQGDGSKRDKGLILCTDNFSLQDISKLVNILILKFDLKPTIQKEKNKYRIYINRKCLLKIKPFITPFFADHFLYKIN
jgi:hypothetical protein